MIAKSKSKDKPDRYIERYNEQLTNRNNPPSNIQQLNELEDKIRMFGAL